MLLTRSAVVAIGLLMLVFGIWFQLRDTAFRTLLDVCMIYYAGALPLLVAGLYWRRATTAGAYLAFVLGACLPAAYVVEDLVIQLQGSNAEGWIASLFSANVRGVLSFLLGFLGMGLGSLLPGGHPQRLEHAERPPE